MFFGLIPLLLYGIAFEGNPFNFRWSPIAVVSLLYLAVVGSVIAFLLYYWLIRNMDVTKTMLISLVTPVVAVILGMLVLDEQLSWRTLVGGAMIIAGNDTTRNSISHGIRAFAQHPDQWDLLRRDPDREGK